jgi:uncharacterized protein
MVVWSETLLSPVERAGVEEFVRQVRERYNERVVKIALFGSRARGDAHEDSDIDILIVLQDPVSLDDRSAVTAMACDVALAAPEFVDISPRTLADSQYRRLLQGEWRFALEVEREGVAL